MSSSPRFHGLIAAPPDGIIGIYWLRLYAVAGGHVAVATEVPGNPGASVVNASDSIIDEVLRRFGVDRAGLMFFAVMPANAVGPEARQVWRVEQGSVFVRAELDEVRMAVGQHLASLPPHAQLLRRVMEMGGDLGDEVHEPVFEAVRIAGLPPPHLPFRCAFADRFQRMKAELGGPDAGGAETALGERFLASLTSADRAACRFHAADWRAIAEASVQIIEAAASSDRTQLAKIARSFRIPDVERRWLVSLFRDPLVIHQRQFSNGQHRGCALRFSGATYVAAVTRFTTRRGEPDVWAYRGDG